MSSPDVCPILNWSRFEALTLGDKSLQSSLRAAFLREAESLRRALTEAANESADAFEQMIHRIRNVSHFIGGDRLGRLAAAVGQECLQGRGADRVEAALLIVSEIDAIEQALMVEKDDGSLQPAAQAPQPARSCDHI